MTLQSLQSLQRQTQRFRFRFRKRSSDLQSDSDLDSIRNSCDVFINKVGWSAIFGVNFALLVGNFIYIGFAVKDKKKPTQDSNSGDYREKYW